MGLLGHPALIALKVSRLQAQKIDPGHRFSILRAALFVPLGIHVVEDASHVSTHQLGLERQGLMEIPQDEEQVRHIVQH